MKRLLIAFLLVSAPSLRAAETTITGGRMELLHKGNDIVFTDGVTLKRDIDVLKASQMTTTGNRDRVTATGNVRLVRTLSSTETWKAWGDEGFYDTKKGAGYLIGHKNPAHVERTEVLSSTMSRIIHIYAKRIDFADEGQSAAAIGQVTGQATDPATHDRYEFASDRADYDRASATVTLTGAPRPWLRQWTGEDRRTVRGDVIVYNLDGRSLKSTGNAEAVLEDAGERKKK